MKKVTRFMLCSCLAVVLFVPGMARAAVPGYYDYLPAWMGVASTFAIDEASLSKYTCSFAVLGFKSTAVSDVTRTGELIPLTARATVLSPLPSAAPVWNALIVDYTDPDGLGTAYQVKATLYRVNRANGSSVPVVTFDSNSSALTTRTEGLIQFAYAFDFKNNEYFVEVNIYKKDTQGNPTVRAVRLATAAGIPK